jgi:hypothetical protein
MSRDIDEFREETGSWSSRNRPQRPWRDFLTTAEANQLVWIDSELRELRRRCTNLSRERSLIQSRATHRAGRTLAQENADG